MSKYAALDTEIINAISRSPSSLRDLAGTSSVIGAVNPFYSDSVDRERLLDRRLQYLRKAGRIKFEHGYWRAVRSV